MYLSDESPYGRGIFSMNVYRRGILVERYEDSNLIVTQGRINVVKLLGGDVLGNSITKIGFGVSNLTTVPGNTALVTPFVKNLNSHTYPTATSVLFNFSLSAAEANGLAISEFGLLTTSGLMHARKVRGGVLLKDADLSITGTWQLLY